MLGCPHAALEQIREAATLLDGRKISAELPAVDLHVAGGQGDRGPRRATRRSSRMPAALLMTDTCSAFAQALPPGTKVAALDSAKQVHYLPAIMGIQAWFGSTRDCINAAITGRWNRGL